MKDRGRIGVAVLLSALMLSAIVASGTASASIPGFGPLHDALFRVTFNAEISTKWEIPEYVNYDGPCYVERTSGSGSQEATFPMRTNPYHGIDTGNGTVFLQPNHLNGGGIKPVTFNRQGDIFHDDTSSGNPCGPGSVPDSSHEDNSGCGTHHEDWNLFAIEIVGNEIRPQLGAEASGPPFACPFYGGLGPETADGGPGFPTNPPFVQEKLPGVRSRLAHRRGVIIVYGKQTMHHDTPTQHAHATATVRWTLKIQRLKGTFTG